MNENFRTPKCISDPDMCEKNEIITETSGSIELNAKSYKNFKSQLFQIKLPADRKVYRFVGSKSQTDSKGFQIDA